MILVTGGAGFIGSNLIQALNAQGHDDIMVVDRLPLTQAIERLRGCTIAAYMDRDAFVQRLKHGTFTFPVSRIFHLAACVDTRATHAPYVLAQNYGLSRQVLHLAALHRIPMVYASSASVYGRNAQCIEDEAYEQPLSVYACSKYLFDAYVRQVRDHLHSPVAGVRYFNVYGPGEAHKGEMASIIYQGFQRLRQTGQLSLFGASHGFAAGEQRRDWIHVDDAVRVTLHFGDGTDRTGIYNVGSGRAHTFNELAQCLIDYVGYGTISYRPMPAELHPWYQPDTCADLTALRHAGYRQPFLDLATGIRCYLSLLDAIETPDYPSHELALSA